jgi:hypothetical protein
VELHDREEKKRWVIYAHAGKRQSHKPQENLEPQRMEPWTATWGKLDGIEQAIVSVPTARMPAPNESLAIRNLKNAVVTHRLSGKLFPKRGTDGTTEVAETGVVMFHAELCSKSSGMKNAATRSGNVTSVRSVCCSRWARLLYHKLIKHDRRNTIAAFVVVSGCEWRALCQK